MNYRRMKLLRLLQKLKGNPGLSDKLFSIFRYLLLCVSMFLCGKIVVFSSRVFPCLSTTQQQPFYGPLSGTTQVNRYQKKHSPTHHPDHHTVFISFFHLLWSIVSSLFKLRVWQIFLHSLFPRPLVYLLVWSPPPHIPYMSSPNQCLLFTTHAHTIAACFAVVPRLYHLFPVFLSTPYLEVYLLP